jgi:uncharacterized protein YkwD
MCLRGTKPDGDETREDTLRYRYLSYKYLILTVCAALFAGVIAGGQSARADTAYDTEELQFLKIINQYRQSKGLEALILSDALTEASERHFRDMGRYGFFDHATAKSSYFPAGSSSWDRMARLGYDYNAYMAENLAAGHETARDSFEAWRGSPGHDRNMLDANQKVLDIARVHVPGSEHGWYWTTDFGSEKDPTSHVPGERPSAKKQTTGNEREARRPNVDAGGVENGSMETDGVWEKKTARDGKRLIQEGVARLGGYDDARDEVLQTVLIKRGQRLVYRVRVETQETGSPTDGLVVRLTDRAGKHLTIVESQTDTDAKKAGEDGWIEGSANLSRFAGKTVKLSFLAKTDEERPTTFYVDDVALK